MMKIWIHGHDACLLSEPTNDLLRCSSSLGNLLLKVGQCLDEEHRRHVDAVELTEPDGFVGTQRLEQRFVEDQNWTSSHVRPPDHGTE